MVPGALENAVVTKYDLNINKIVSNKKTLKVIMVSDIHLGVIVDNNRLTDMVNKIRQLNPDIVFIPGDIIDSNLEPFVKEKMGDNFTELKVSMEYMLVLEIMRNSELM